MLKELWNWLRGYPNTKTRSRKMGDLTIGGDIVSGISDPPITVNGQRLFPSDDHASNERCMEGISDPPQRLFGN
jgi:hypothetical protein